MTLAAGAGMREMLVRAYLHQAEGGHAQAGAARVLASQIDCPQPESRSQVLLSACLRSIETGDGGGMQLACRYKCGASGERRPRISEWIAGPAPAYITRCTYD